MTSKRPVLFIGSDPMSELLKSNVAAYTRKDGTFVAAHSDKRSAAKYDHPAVVGHAHDHKEIADNGYGEKKGSGDPTSAITTSIGFAGKEYRPTGKKGYSLHDNTPVNEFEHEETGHRINADNQGRVHADDTTEVKGLRKKNEDYLAKNGGGAKPATRAKRAPTTKTDNEGYGFHGEAFNEHLRAKHGVDYNLNKVSEKDHAAASKHANKQFSAAAHKLVQHGVMPNHKKAGEFLDSSRGRHLHDSIARRDKSPDYANVHKVGWLKKEAKKHK